MPEESPIQPTPTTPQPTTSPTPTTPTAPATEASPSAETPTLLNEGAKPAVEEAPSSYADFKVPEGFQLDAEAAKQAGTLFKEMNLSQAKAQKLIDFYVAKTTEAIQQPFDAWKATQERWIEEVKLDPQIGGKLDQVKSEVAKAIDGLGDPKLANDFRVAMDMTGAGNNPAFIRAFYQLALKVNEGKPVPAGGPAAVRAPGQAPPSVAAAMYPNLPSARGG